MSTFPSVNPLWDFNLPADSLATLPDDDFLAILHSQIAEANNNNNNPQTQPFASYYVPQQSLPQEINSNINGKAAPQIPQTATPPSLSDSTPSPPSGFESNLVDETARADFEANGWSNASGDDARKRKASFATESMENDQQHPSQRSHITDQGSLPKAPSRRKSSGNHGADEQRLLKRKEQNRAAQRAFRERKEKHVKDLEEQLAALASRNESTQAENDNLREMLRRLQAENTLLKQAAFTFSVPGGTSFPAADSAPSSSSSITPTKSTANQSLSPNGSTNTLSTAPPPRSAEDQVRSPGDSNQPVYGTNQQWMAPSTSTQGAFPSPFTIISSNPTYMSYRDPAPSAAPLASFTNSFTMSSSPDGNLQAFSPKQQAYQSFLSPDVVMNDFNTGSTSFDSVGYTFPALGNENINLDDLYPGRSDSSTTSFSLNSSPATSATSVQSVDKESQQAHKESGCTQDALAREIANRGPSIFVGEDYKKQLSGRPIPTIPKSDANIDAELAYQSLRSHPQLKDLDVNDLCQDFAEKVRCDGSKAVLSPNGMHELVELLRSRVAQT